MIHESQKSYKVHKLFLIISACDVASNSSHLGQPLLLQIFNRLIHILLISAANNNRSPFSQETFSNGESDSENTNYEF